MQRDDFRREQYASLRREIESQQTRLYWTVVIGLLGVPAITHMVWDASTLVWPVLPLLVLVLIVMFLALQNQMMRVGRFIREHLESEVPAGDGWEGWLESKPQLRLMDKHFSACFIIIFFLYYFLALGFASYRLWLQALEDPSGNYFYFLYGAIACYTIATIWAIATLLMHWRESTSTAAPSSQK